MNVSIFRHFILRDGGCFLCFPVNFCAGNWRAASYNRYPRARLTFDRSVTSGYHSRFMSALLHVYFPPRLKNICSSNPLAFMASSTPTSSRDLDGVFAPDLQSRKRI